MFFNSASFLFVFLPVVLAGYFFLERLPRIFWRQVWLLAASLVFYGWANPQALLLFIPLILVNFIMGNRLLKSAGTPSRLILGGGIAFNLLVLGYFKYANFFVSNLNAVLQDDLFLDRILLPLGISFLTFMQIAWLVASYRKEAVPCSLFEYFLYSAFFPQVVSGPIVYQKESLPQFRKSRTSGERTNDICVGATLFSMGLAKKVLLADPLGPWATQVFWAAGEGHSISLCAAWIGALAYAFQLYFDFSGYSDMALGVARLFGIRLPLNFNSPYKAESISDFWRRWHMTLSRFLRDFVYIPLGGSRCGGLRRSMNLFLTMLLGGFWHGAGWTFLLWGALHGGYLVINHQWSLISESRIIPCSFIFSGWGGRLLTFAAVLVAWLFFRASKPEDAWQILVAMVGGGGPIVGNDPLFSKSSPVVMSVLGGGGLPLDPQVVMMSWLLILTVFVWVLPNSQQILRQMEPGLITYGKTIEPISPAFGFLEWKPRLLWLLATTVLFFWCLLNLTGGSFLYRDF